MKIHFDQKALEKLDHQCVPSGKCKPYCCSQYEVCVSKKEMRAIENAFPWIAEYCPDLIWDTEPEIEYDNVFDEIDKNLYAIETDENGLCVFAYKYGRGVRCAIHSVALDRNIPLAKIKPLSCILWPLALSSGRKKVVTVQDDAYEFHCNKRKRTKGLCQAAKDSIEEIQTNRPKWE